MSLRSSRPSVIMFAGASRARARVVWSALAALVALVAIAALAGAAAVPAPTYRGDVRSVLVVAVPMVAVELSSVYLVTRHIRRAPPPGTPPYGVAMMQVVVASLLCVAAVLMCCIFFLVTREPLLIALVLPCAAVLLHWFPSEARWTRLTPARAGAGPAPRPMIRE